MQSIDTGYCYIREGVVDLILAGGTEALSYAPLVPNAGVRWFAGLAGAHLDVLCRAVGDNAYNALRTSVARN